MPAEPLPNQVREAAGQNDRLLARVVVVRLEVHRVHVDVGEHLHGQRGGRAPPCSAWPPADRRRWSRSFPAHRRADTHVEDLREPDQRRVDHRLAVRVIVTGRVAGDLGALPVRPPRRQVEVVHRDQHAPLRGLQAVARIGQRSRDDHAHGVVEVGALHLLFDVDLADRAEIHHLAVTSSPSTSASGGRIPTPNRHKDTSRPRPGGRCSEGRTCEIRNTT